MDDNMTAVDRPERNRFELSANGGQPAALLSYRLEQGRIHLVHTEVSPAHEGKGLGSQIARFALGQARQRNLKVVASCSFVKDFVQRNPQYQDLLDEA